MLEKKVLTCLIAVGLIFTLGSAAQAATLNYKILLDGQDVEEVPADGGGIVTIGTMFDVDIYVNVPDVDFGGGYYGGCLQYACHFTESDDGLVADEALGGPPFFPPTGDWNSSSVSPMSNYKGEVDNPGYLVFGQTGAIPPGDWAANFNTFGAGPGVWSKVGSGGMTWDGKATVLTLTPDALDAQVVYGLCGSGEAPTAAGGDTVTFLPEPATMTLLALGGLALIRRRRD
ncbi:MAG: PEP-CTERM sorting domain-containing protein [Planctomycetes bacterium]|nr:PEP-CTERM sorting domain-containing protein [Planctomycetota bacterium]